MTLASATADAEQRESAPVGRGTALVDRVLDASIFLSLVVLVVVFSLLSPEFLTVDNLLNILDASAIVGIVAVGVTIALIGGHFDLSIGSIVGLSSSVLALTLTDWGVPALPAIGLAIVAALLIGVVNGILVVEFGINSIIATLGMLAAVRGLAFVVSSGKPIPVENDFLTSLGTSQPLGIPISVYIMAVAYAGAWVLLTQTRLGLHIYAVGGDPVAAERAGIRHNQVTRLLFLATALCAAIGAVLMTARNFSGQAVFGRDLEFDVLTAVLLGGIGLRGGEGSVVRTLVGVAIVGVITNGLVLTEVPPYWTDVARGGVLILAVVLEAVRERRGRR